VPISAVHSYLVHAGKGLDDQPKIRGTAIPLSGALYEMLRRVYDNADAECKIEISFDRSAAGKQQNDCRDLVTSYISKPNLINGRAIATRLQDVTTNRSRLGLLFLSLGSEAGEEKLVISRFPADIGILAEEHGQTLDVRLLEKVFLKSATAYKSVVYRGKSVKSDFWTGRAIDKQINDNVVTLSDYWIRDFLASDFRTTAAAGTRRLALGLRAAMKDATDISVKDEIAAACKLVLSQDGKMLSAQTFASHFGLTDQAKETLRRELKDDDLFNEEFSFSREEFSKYIMERYSRRTRRSLTPCSKGRVWMLRPMKCDLLLMARLWITSSARRHHD
jgi:hypothetical protein